jgi:hypothetical protein
MVQVFATKVWGLNFAAVPLLVFSKEGNRQSYLNRAEPGALVCLVATKGKNTRDEDRGKVLGIVEAGSVLVNAESLLLDRGKIPKRDRDEDGRYKWPYGLSLQKAWYFSEKPVADKLIGKLHFSSVSGCELLSEKAARRVLREKRSDVRATDLELFLRPANSRDPGRKNNGPKPALGVPPGVSGYQVTRRKMTSFVYILRFQNTDIFKVGWAFDVQARARDINQHIPSEVLDQQWEVFLWREYPDQFYAYDAEQRLLQGPLKKHRTRGERFTIGENALRSIWRKFEVA